MNEHKILHMLEGEILLSPAQVRMVMALVLLDCYDRKVQRDFMARMLDYNQQMNITLSELESGYRRRELLLSMRPDCEPKLIDEELNKIGLRINMMRDRVAAEFKLVCQCSCDGDTIH